MRNATTTLDATSVLLDTNVRILAQHIEDDSTVTLSYVKRSDGTHSSAHGTFIGFVGEQGMSTSALKVDTTRGPRTINTYLLTGMLVHLSDGSTVESKVFDDLHFV